MYNKLYPGNKGWREREKKRKGEKIKEREDKGSQNNLQIKCFIIYEKPEILLLKSIYGNIIKIL